MDIVCANLERKIYLVSSEKLENTVSHIADIEGVLSRKRARSVTGVSARTTRVSAECADWTCARGKWKVEVLEAVKVYGVRLSGNSRPQVSSYKNKSWGCQNYELEQYFGLFLIGRGIQHWEKSISEETSKLHMEVRLELRRTKRWVQPYHSGSNIVSQLIWSNAQNIFGNQP